MTVMPVSIAAPAPAVLPAALRQPARGRWRPAPEVRRRRQRAFAFGVESEKLVAAFLHAGDYKVLAQRARVGAVEVDLIVARDDVVAFVEVKARRNGWDGLEAVTPAKMRRLSRAADQWLARNDAYAGCSIRFDIALVGADRTIEYLENAFEAQPADDFVF